jgi:hypothetical protein
MSTATALYGSNPITLNGAEKVWLDKSDGTLSGGCLSQDIANLYKGTKAANLASAATVTLASATGMVVHITGTTTITSFGNATAGLLREVIFDGALTLTHNATSLILQRSANITTAAGDTALMFCDTTNNWRCLRYTKQDGSPLTAASTVSDAILRSPITALTNSSGTVTVDCSLGRNFTITLGANVTTLTLSNLAGAGFATEIEIEIKQDGTGSRTFALPASFKALGGSDTAITSAPNSVTVLSAKTFDNGTTWRYAMQESA